MVLTRLVIFIVFIFNIVSAEDTSIEKNIEDNEVLKKIISKQALYNIRFVSKDSSFTIYQKHTGGLFLSTNYDVKKILDSTENTQFNILGSAENKYLVLTKKTNYHQEFNPKHEVEIFYYAYDLKQEAKFLGKGTNPKIHRGGDFVTFLKPTENTLKVHKLSLPTNNFSINMSDSANPYFTPHIEMMDDENIIIYEQNLSGIGQVVKINLETQKRSVLKKLSNYQARLEMCIQEKNLFFLTSNYLESNSENTELSKINMNDNSEELIYSSKKNDLGQMACKTELNYIYFIKNFSENKKNYFDVAKVSIVDKSIQRITNEDYITNIFEMDGRLIAVNNGVQMLLFGENSLKKDSIPSRR